MVGVPTFVNNYFNFFYNPFYGGNGGNIWGVKRVANCVQWCPVVSIDQYERSALRPLFTGVECAF